mgnify:CR=1 FL=1
MKRDTLSVMPRGGRRPGAGRKPSPDSKRAILAVRIAAAELAKLAVYCASRNITPADAVREWIANL